MELTATDQRILEELTRDARLSMRELATRVGVSTPTASAKVKALEAMGLIKGYRVVLDGALLGGAGHVLEVETPPARAAEVARALAALEGIEDVVETAGGRLFARHRAGASTDALVAALSGIGSIASFKLHRVVGESAAERAPSANIPVVALACHFCGGAIEGAGVRRRWKEDGEREHWFCCRNCAEDFGEKLLKLARS